MMWDSNHAHDPMRSAALIAATRCRVDDEPPSWEPVSDLDHLKVCEHAKWCSKGFCKGDGALCTERYVAHEMGCSTCNDFEDSGVMPI